ncbi:MAG TPA: multicopper oxidase domain-containing protein [Acidimicrobiales bacterium]|nr:multicopper oxidase domain-containing protein [Acidimicrobiales bacterium]
MRFQATATRSRSFRRERVRVTALMATVLLVLGLTAPADGRESGPPEGACGRAVPVRDYDVAAIAVDVTVNRYLDHDPEGRMFVLEEDLGRVRAEEAVNAAARAGGGEPAVTAGLQGDAIQPLTLRVLPGECLRVTLRNALAGAEAASLHVHGADLRVAGSGGPAIATNPAAVARPGRTVTYEWMVDPGEPEGTHHLHSHGDTRAQTSHGLFGSIVVEPPGSRWLDPRTGAPLRSGWDAVIRSGAGSDFREFALYYHEIGHENYQLLDAADRRIPLVDPVTSAYRPGGRALNYRSEPFGHRLALQVARAPVGAGTFDEAVAYSSYAFGDPATPMMRAYLGDPTKQRVVHGGSEVFHVHHVHGGATRWPRQPGVEDTRFDSGEDKRPPLLPKSTERTDSQSLGPSETFDVVPECGSGGCQGSVGDFLYHCHVAEHYFAGMWGLWRTYNTLQNGSASTDALPPLRELPERQGHVLPAVTSEKLVGAAVVSANGPFTIAQSEMKRWVERQLPPQGQPRGYDAAVHDWSRQGDTYLGEPETDQAWPGYRSPAPGQRPPLRFDPRTGKLAFPFLRPHLGKRPPFAPNHGPSPFLEPDHDGTDPPVPGANGKGSLCPAGSHSKKFDLQAVEAAIPVNEEERIVDAGGLLFVLKEQEAAARTDPDLRRPLAIRANAGEDCVDVVLTSRLTDTPESHGFSKVNAHIHFVQFDVQASDGVVSGFNFEQSVRPFQLEGAPLARPAVAGAAMLRMADASRLQPGVVVGIGMGGGERFEAVAVTAVEGALVTLSKPLEFDHAAGEIVSTEFVRYRWYDDTQFGTAYFHDHVNAIGTWRRGLFGALVSEPPGSTYHDPRTGEEIRSGAIADIHTDARVSADVKGSFRELVSFVQDDSAVNHVGRSTGSALNLRAEPLDRRKGDPAMVFSSRTHGDPATPVIEANVGDPVVVRSLVSASNEVHTWHLDGHWFRKEPQSQRSPPVSTVHLGISERYDLVVPAAGGPQRMPGDYIYGNGRSVKLREGSWGLLRVLPGRQGDAAPGGGARSLPGNRASEAAPDSGPALLPLPGHEVPPRPPAAVCPPAAPVREFDVVAIEAPLPMLGGRPGRLFVLAQDARAVRSGQRPAEPLVLHVGVGECLKLHLRNAVATGSVSLRCDLLASDPLESGGVAAGFNPDQTVAPGEVRTSTFYASPEVGETVSVVRDGGDVVANSALGLYGAIVVGPAGSTYRDAASGTDMGGRSGWNVVVQPPSGPAYRDFTLLFQDEDASIGTHRMPYTTNVQGTVGVNYRNEPLKGRLNSDPDAATVYSSSTTGRPLPSTPLLEAFAGDPVRIHALAPWSEQSQVFSVEGHRWAMEPGRRGTNMLSSVPLGGLDVVTANLEGGAGGRGHRAGDYLWGDHREPYREAGLWGIFRVLEPHARGGTIRPLPAPRHRSSGRSGLGPGPVLSLIGLALLVAGGAVAARRRRLTDQVPKVL